MGVLLDLLVTNYPNDLWNNQHKPKGRAIGLNL